MRAEDGESGGAIADAGAHTTMLWDLGAQMIAALVELARWYASQAGNGSCSLTIGLSTSGPHAATLQRVCERYLPRIITVTGSCSSSKTAKKAPNVATLNAGILWKTRTSRPTSTLSPRRKHVHNVHRHVLCVYRIERRRATAAIMRFHHGRRRSAHAPMMRYSKEKGGAKGVKPE
ncbi:hypothetical protein HDU88_000582 [Geranomyces variabilis]|nr:hypothetical protein HDU88_000582 [Geranomyces variabilis]